MGIAPYTKGSAEEIVKRARDDDEGEQQEDDVLEALENDGGSGRKVAHRKSGA